MWQDLSQPEGQFVLSRAKFLPLPLECVWAPFIQAPPCWSGVESQAQWRVHFRTELLSWAGEWLWPLTRPGQGQMAARGPAWKPHLCPGFSLAGLRPDGFAGSSGAAPGQRCLCCGGASAAGHSRLCQRTGALISSSAVRNNRTRLPLLCCPTGDAVGDFTVRFYSNFYSTGFNRPGVRPMCSYTADFPFSALPWSLQSKQTFNQVLKKSLAPASSSCPADWSGQECTGCSPTTEQKDDPCLFWSLQCKSDSIWPRQSPGGQR